MTARGSSLEALVAASAKNLDAWGLSLRQTSPRFVGRVLPGGQAVGRLMGHGGLDFAGDWWGRAVTFDCKSCRLKTRFPLDNLKDHQVEIVRTTHERGGIAFFLVEFAALDTPRYLALTWTVLRPVWEHRLTERSIPIDTMLARCEEFRFKGRRLDLLDGLTRLDAAEPPPGERTLLSPHTRTSRKDSR